MDLTKTVIFDPARRIRGEHILELLADFISYEVVSFEHLPHLPQLRKFLPHIYDRHEEPVLRLAHFSVQEYLLSPRAQECRASMFAVRSGKVHQLVAQSCLLYLEHYSESRGDVPPGRASEIQKKAYPLLDYSGKFWYEHSRQQDPPVVLHEIGFLENERARLNWQYVADPVEAQGGVMRHCPERGNALLCAASCGLNAVVQHLISSKHDLDKESNFSFPLQAACHGGHKEIVRMLLDAGANINNKGGLRGTALSTACNRGYWEIVQFLAERGADVDIQSQYGRASLHEAAQYGQESIVQLLIDSGADVNIRNDYGEVPLHGAIRSGDQNVVKLLIEQGADIHLQDIDGRQTLHIAAQSGEEGIASILMDKGANILSSDGSVENLLSFAAYGGYRKLVELLLEKGSNINSEDDEGVTALHNAAMAGNETIVQMLLEEGANIDSTDKAGMVALHYAASNGSENAVSILLEKGADIDSTDRYGLVALHWATLLGHENILAFLLEKGANIDLANNDGNKALSLALATKSAHGSQDDSEGYEKWSRIVNLLLSRGAIV